MEGLEKVSETIITKTYGGDWKAKTLFKYKSLDIEVTTQKGSRSVRTHAQTGKRKIEDDFISFTFAMFEHPSWGLDHPEAKRATGKTIEACHDAALAFFAADTAFKTKMDNYLLNHEHNEPV